MFIGISLINEIKSLTDFVCSLVVVPNFERPVSSVSKIPSKTFLCDGEISLLKEDKAIRTLSIEKSEPISIHVEKRFSYAMK